MTRYRLPCPRCGTPIWPGDPSVVWTRRGLAHVDCPDPHDDRLDRDEALGDWHDHLATVADHAERGEAR